MATISLATSTSSLGAIVRWAGRWAPVAHGQCGDPRIALWHGEQRASPEARGVTPTFADGQIAAIAATQGLVLVTRNITDFEVFEGLQLLNGFAA